MSAKNINKQSRTDWDRIKAMQDEDIDFSDAPELGDDFFAKAVPWPAQKKQITLRLDQEVLDFFKAQGRGYQTAINNVLVRYVEAQQEKPVDPVRKVKFEKDVWVKRDASTGRFTDTKKMDGAPFQGVRKEDGQKVKAHSGGVKAGKR